MDNFYHTAQRTFKSSQTLHANAEYHNACYMAGYVVECYAKILLGLVYGTACGELKDYAHDMKRLNKEIQYLLSDSTIGTSLNSAYILPLARYFSVISHGNKKWNPIKRYVHNSQEWNHNDSINYQNEVQIAMRILAQMKIDGLTLP
ncbi:hypothetical protein JW964_18520 [candidate division KSB1 bacterium]|nr:hypothetical protein [candidate division KSB1 bacterium]